MSALLKSLDHLTNAIENLETSVELYQSQVRQELQTQHAQANPQTDMFAEKLDQTIHRVETALKEA